VLVLNERRWGPGCSGKIAVRPCQECSTLCSDRVGKRQIGTRQDRTAIGRFSAGLSAATARFGRPAPSDTETSFRAIDSASRGRRRSRVGPWPDRRSRSKHATNLVQNVVKRFVARDAVVI
jgi:hypothetical protein